MARIAGVNIPDIQNHTVISLTSIFWFGNQGTAIVQQLAIGARCKSGFSEGGEISCALELASQP